MIYKIPDPGAVTDSQFVRVAGPDGLVSGFQYDKETRSFYIKEAQVLFPGFHGVTHVSDDPIPEATTDTQGLMSADDKAKLESLIQTKVGVLGFHGAGYADDGGWLQGPIVLATGSEMLSIEKIGNVVRFTVDTPVPLVCNCEECAQIYWIQDESDVNAIRPPSCAGKLPGANVYGELKIHLFPESTILDPSNPRETFDRKDDYPALIFKRYENNVQYSGQIEAVLKRNANKTTNIGWSMTPGPENIAECVWFTGSDADGRTIRFELDSREEPGMLGALVYKGHTITRRMGVVTAWEPTIVTDNKYRVKYWDVQEEKSIGGEFVAQNIWQYVFPDTIDQQLGQDAYIQILPIGTLVSLWEFNVKDTDITRRYFSKQPNVNPEHIWSLSSRISFGNTYTQYDNKDDPTEDHTEVVSDYRVIDQVGWGISNFNDPLYFYSEKLDKVRGPFNNLYQAQSDPNLPGLVVTENAWGTDGVTDITGATASTNITGGTDGVTDITGVTEITDIDPLMERPVFMWHHSDHANFFTRIFMGMPDSSRYPPIDIIFRSPIDQYKDVFMQVVGQGENGGKTYIMVEGVSWDDLPHAGAIRFMTLQRNLIWKFDRKVMASGNRIMLMSDEELQGRVYSNNSIMSIASLVHADFNVAAARLEFSVNDLEGSEAVQMQLRVGLLDMSVPYEYDEEVTIADDLIKGFRPGQYAVSRWFTQNGFWTGPDSDVSGSPEQFIVYQGGWISDTQQQWNILELMVRDDQLWAWWNGIILAPDPFENSQLPVPVPVDTPYFDISAFPTYGKYGLRMWPGAKIRSVEIRDQNMLANELLHGQLEIVG